MERLSDIVAQMRGRGEDGRMDRRLWLDYADRIEAAAKRERETWRQRVKDALAVADQFKGALDHVLNAALFAQQEGAGE